MAGAPARVPRTDHVFGDIGRFSMNFFANAVCGHPDVGPVQDVGEGITFIEAPAGDSGHDSNVRGTAVRWKANRPQFSGEGDRVFQMEDGKVIVQRRFAEAGMHGDLFDVDLVEFAVRSIMFSKEHSDTG